ncbi:exonuclease SbcCD subunit D C-terminal domain-containing protein, partial [Pseudomonas aeruginosa]|uniref:exonuclease SbcCD subunit D C-terminal domain-containing protein n=1 Tax=Pseudomonas aeruginosa TaxID=287 RepID=UPI00209CEC97
DHEHARFLDWLLRQLEEQRADVLLIAGDIFDTINPPLKAQERLYDFIVSAHRRLPRLEIVMIAGNHDSGARIELPAPLMKRLNAHAIGRVGWIDESLDSDRLLLPLHDADGQVAAWCLALPFLRPAEVTGGGLGDDYLAGIRQVHERLVAAAQACRKPGQALVAVSHAHMAGGAVSEDSERNLIIGNVEALPASLFPEQIAYVALGHLHKPQKVAGQERIRYSGSPLPLSFAEVNYRHQVLLVTLEGERLKDVQSLPVPRAVELLRIGPAPLGEVLDRIGELAEADLRQQVESALQGKACRLVRIASEYQRPDEEQAPLLGLDQLNPQELFSRAWESAYGSGPDAQALDDFASLLQSVELATEEPPGK